MNSTGSEFDSMAASMNSMLKLHILRKEGEEEEEEEEEEERQKNKEKYFVT
jgi:hypothetical protein